MGHTDTNTYTHTLSGLQGEGNEINLFVVVWVKGVKNDIIMDTRRKLLLIRYRFGELIID